MENLFWMHFILGPFFLGIAFLFKIFPPRSINYLYGYRTRRSMKSDTTWQAANKLSANLMVGVGFATCLAQGIFYSVGMAFEAYVGWSSGVLVVLLLATIPVVEAHLKKNFDEQGNPISE